MKAGLNTPASPHAPQFFRTQFFGVLISGGIDTATMLPGRVQDQLAGFESRCRSRSYAWAKLMASDNGQELLSYTPTDGVKTVAKTAGCLRGDTLAFRPLRAGTPISANGMMGRVVRDNIDTVDVVHEDRNVRWEWADEDGSPCLVLG